MRVFRLRRVVSPPADTVAGVPIDILFLLAFVVLGVEQTQAADSRAPTTASPGVVEWRFELLAADAPVDLAMRDAAQKEDVDIRPPSAGSGGFSLEGAHDLAALRRLLSGKVLPRLDLIGGVASLEIRAMTEPDRDVRIELPTNPSTGAEWSLESRDWIEVREPVLISDSGVPGAVAREVHSVRAMLGADALRFIYRRPWAPDAPVDRTLLIEALAFPPRLDLSRPDEVVPRAPGRECPPPRSRTTRVSGLEEEDETAVAAGSTEAASPTVMTLPRRFDWRDHGVVPLVKDQGLCGSCWAFAAAAASEAAVALATAHAPPDYSEQYLVSCDVHSDGCDGGWAGAATDLHISRVPEGQDDAGPVLERDLPYQGVDGTCDRPLAHGSKLIRWSPLIDGGREIPPEAAVKAALLEHGPLFADICVDRAFHSYRQGVFNKDERKACTCSSNHQMLLVGWDDDDKAWIAKNSWGEDWGEAGYVRIRHGVSNFPVGASYVVYDPAPEALPEHENGSVERPISIPGDAIGGAGIVLEQSVGLQVSSPGPVFPGTEPAFANPTNMVWYTVHPQQSGLLTVETLTSNYDTIVGLWRRESGTGLELVGWNDDLAGGTGMRPSFLQASVEPPNEYLIGVSSFDPYVRGRLSLGIRLAEGRSGEILDDRDDLRIAFKGKWSLEWQRGSYQAYVHKGTKSAIAALELEEGPFQVVYPTVVGAGTLGIYLDGKRIGKVKQGVKTCVSERRRLIFAGVVRGAGTHRLELVQSGNGPIYVDAILLGDVLLPEHIERR